MASLALSASRSASPSRSASLSISGPTSTSTSTTAPSASTQAPALAQVEDPTIRFTSINELFQFIDSVQGDILIVTHVSPQDFHTIEHERESRRRKFRFRRYYASSQILIIAIPTQLHEQLHLVLNRQYEHKLVRMGLEDSWKSIGTATYRTQGHPGGDGGESDSSGGPRPKRGGRNNWPTLVIEAGHSESLTRLRQDMRWWFDASNHQVKIVLLAKFNHSQREIQLEKWEEEPQVARPGVTTTRLIAASTLAPVLRQRITITRNATSPPSYNVTSGALVLSFGLLFLRDPGPGEGDFVFSIPDLQFYAECVWEEV